jgi:hypothetical protein
MGTKRLKRSSIVEGSTRNGRPPYLEISGDWRDFHARFLNGCADVLSDQLPDNYVARIEEQFQILAWR